MKLPFANNTIWVAVALLSLSLLSLSAALAEKAPGNSRELTLQGVVIERPGDSLQDNLPSNLSNRVSDDNGNPNGYPIVENLKKNGDAADARETGTLKTKNHADEAQDGDSGNVDGGGEDR